MSDSGSVLKVNERPTIRLKKPLAYALALYNAEKNHNSTQTITAALTKFLPAKYLRRGEQITKGL